MTYEIEILRNEDGLTIIKAIVKDETGETVVDGQTSVMITEDNLFDTEGMRIFADIEAAARNYAENIFLPDLRNNFRKIKDLVLPCDSQG
jgi:hypothetical protein